MFRSPASRQTPRQFLMRPVTGSYDHCWLQLPSSHAYICAPENSLFRWNAFRQMPRLLLTRPELSTYSHCWSGFAAAQFHMCTLPPSVPRSFASKQRPWRFLIIPDAAPPPSRAPRQEASALSRSPETTPYLPILRVREPGATRFRKQTSLSPLTFRIRPHVHTSHRLSDLHVAWHELAPSRPLTVAWERGTVPVKSTSSS
mmetsp:Transcript_82176/g.232956  ORF Transcript_82176/g.232956 Transcript_82176/m.232956 type:complete len:201 (+) Transcript_82176:100-702(+)